MLQTVFLRGALPAMSKKRAPALRRRAVHVSATANAFNRTAQQGFNPNNSTLARQGGQQLSFRPRTRARQAPPPQELPDEPEQTEQNEEVERRVVNDNEEYTEEATSAYSGHQQPQEGRPRQQKGSPSPLLAIYRPNRDSAKGSAAQFGYSSQKRSVYLSMAKQAGDKTAPGSSDKQFGWDNKIVFKLDVPDMSKLLNALDGRVPALDILHMSEGSTQQRYTTLKTKPATHGNGVYMSLLRAEGENKQMVSILIDDTDARTLTIFLDESIRRALGFKPETQ